MADLGKPRTDGTCDATFSKLLKRTKVFVASNVELVSEGLQLRLCRCSQIEVVGHGRLDAVAGTTLRRQFADVVVLDFGSTGSSVFAARLRNTSPSIQIVGIAIGSTTLELADWAELGVAGFVDDNGSIEDVIAAIRRVACGEFFCSPRTTATLVNGLVNRRHMPEGMRRLTPRETQIVLDLERGATNKEIALRLGISAATVKNHVHNVLEKLEVRRRQDVGAIIRSQRI